MKPTKMLYFGAVVIFALGVQVAHGQGKSKDHGRGPDKDKHGDRDDDRNRGNHPAYVYSYSKHDRDQLNDWYSHHRGNLPPGLAKKDRLPPGWEKKLVVHQVLPVEYRTYVRPAPVEIIRILPPPPPDYEHVAIGGRIVLMNRRTSVVVDIFNLGF